MNGNSEVIEEEERRSVRSVFACYNNNKMDRYLLPELLPVTGNLPEQWARFKKQFEQFIDASEKAGVSDKAKIAILLRTIGDKGNDIFENFAFEANEQPTFDDVVATFFLTIMQTPNQCLRSQAPVSHKETKQPDN